MLMESVLCSCALAYIVICFHVALSVQHRSRGHGKLVLVFNLKPPLNFQSISPFMPSFHARPIHSPTFHRFFRKDRKRLFRCPVFQTSAISLTDDHCKIWTQLFAGTFTDKAPASISRFNISQVRHLEPLFIWKENMFSSTTAKWQSNPFGRYG